ncbi:uncharacterized protein LOC113274422 isoform X1 [Papaver somniferum]|uniref:uncharacterized protein LOC113274422 isoform X1 n=1 Tax=Papaver somniferum TaxID=3469 RepID=UPI000E6FD613|nr:uncharacterized protein LOC113274422 isoform X1 [Papaver somniferum]
MGRTEPSPLGGSSNIGMSAEIGYKCARKEVISSIALGKKRAGICSDNIRQQVEKCSRRKISETNLKKDVLSMFAEARNVPTTSPLPTAIPATSPIPTTAAAATPTPKETSSVSPSSSPTSWVHRENTSILGAGTCEST